METSAPPAAELHSASRIFGRFAALRNVSASFPAGTCTVILGENGAGKSTLLRLLAGLTSLSRGSVSVLGGSPQQARGRVAYMSHASMLYDELTAMENLTYFSSLHRSAGDCGCAANPEMALRAVGLDPSLTRPLGQYSQGMRQRASLARVLVADPELLLLDEPFSNLDISSVSTMLELLSDFRTWPLRGGGRRTVIMTTHHADLVRPMADATLTLRRGEVISHEPRTAKP